MRCEKIMRFRRPTFSMCLKFLTTRQEPRQNLSTSFQTADYGSSATSKWSRGRFHPGCTNHLSFHGLAYEAFTNGRQDFGK
jgi:hypothetical protein